MTIAPKVKEILDARNAAYELIDHPPTGSSLEAARAAQIPAGRLAKAVLLATDQGHLLAVVPANRQINLDAVSTAIGRTARLAREPVLSEIFDDCDTGAVPPLAEAYHVPMLIDRHLDAEPDLFLEAGDHASIIHIRQAEFARLTAGAKHLSVAGASLEEAAAGFWYV